jgi:hypothetical protein
MGVEAAHVLGGGREAEEQKQFSTDSFFPPAETKEDSGKFNSSSDYKLDSNLNLMMSQSSSSEPTDILLKAETRAVAADSDDDGEEEARAESSCGGDQLVALNAREELLSISATDPNSSTNRCTPVSELSGIVSYSRFYRF